MKCTVAVEMAFHLQGNEAFRVHHRKWRISDAFRSGAICVALLVGHGGSIVRLFHAMNIIWIKMIREDLHSVLGLHA